MGIKSLSPVEPYYNFFAQSGDGVGPAVVANTPFTATGGTKPAILETGAQVMVPLFISIGEKIKVDTRNDSYLGRETS